MKPWHVQFSVLPGALVKFIDHDLALLVDEGLDWRGPGPMMVDLRSGEAAWVRLDWLGRVAEKKTRMEIFINHP